MPQIGPCQALVKMESCGVCNGTDRKLIHRTFKNFHTYPAILGHEGVGKVVKTGEFVENLQVGDRVLLPFLEEAADGYVPGWGAYAEYCVVGDEKSAIRLAVSTLSSRISVVMTVLSPSSFKNLVKQSPTGPAPNTTAVSLGWNPNLRMALKTSRNVMIMEAPTASTRSSGRITV